MAVFFSVVFGVMWPFNGPAHAEVHFFLWATLGIIAAVTTLVVLINTVWLCLCDA